MNAPARFPSPRRTLATICLPFAIFAAACGGTSPSTGATTPAGTVDVATTAPTGAGTATAPRDDHATAPTGGGGGGGGGTATIAGGEPATVVGALPPPVPLDKTVWWSPDLDQHGLVKIHFTQAQLDPTAPIPTITLTYTAQNIQHSTRFFSFGSESVMTVAGKPSSQPQGTQLQLTADTATAGTVAFQVDATATIDDAVLTLGDPDSNQSVIPLRPTSPVTTTEPRTGFATGTIHGLDHDITVTSSILYADTTLGRKHKSVLALTVNATYTGPGGGLIGTDNFSLRMPDGTNTPGVQIVGEPLEPLNDALNTGQTSASQLLGFEVDQPSNGPYTLTYTSTAATDQDQPATVDFTIGS